MRVAIVGVGGVGGYFGGLLAKRYRNTDSDTVIFVARGAHLNAIQTNGLHLITTSAEFVVEPDKATDKDTGGPLDLVLLCTKVYDLERSAMSLAPYLRKKTAIIPLLNGVDVGVRLRRVLDAGQIFEGCVYIAASIVEPGTVIQVGGSCKLFFGGGSVISGQRIEQFLKNAGIDAKFAGDIERILWRKFLFVSPFANATTVLGCPIRAVLDDDEGKELVQNLIAEVLALATVKGINLPDDVVEATYSTARSFPKEAKTSMQLDYEKGRRVETETLTEYVLTESCRHGLTAPVHEKVLDKLKSSI